MKVLGRKAPGVVGARSLELCSQRAWSPLVLPRASTVEQQMCRLACNSLLGYRRANYMGTEPGIDGPIVRSKTEETCSMARVVAAGTAGPATAEKRSE